MNISRKLLFLMIFSVSFVSLYAMKHNKQQITLQKHTTQTKSPRPCMKGFYTVFNAIGIPLLASYQAYEVMNIAEANHHQDPASEATAAFLIAGFFASCISISVWKFTDFIFFKSSHPVFPEHAENPSNRFRKQQNKTPYQEALQKETKKSTKRDKRNRRKKRGQS